MGEGGKGDEGQRKGAGGRGAKEGSSSTPRRAISRFSHQDAQTPSSPRVREGGKGDEGQRKRAAARPDVPSPVSGIRTPTLPLLPVWEQGARGMRGKGRGQRKGARGMRGKSAQGLPGNAGHLLNHIITQTAQTPDCRSSVRGGSGAHRVRRARSTPVPPVPPVPPQTRHPSPCRSDHENGSCSPRRSTATP